MQITKGRALRQSIGTESVVQPHHSIHGAQLLKYIRFPDNFREKGKSDSTAIQHVHVVVTGDVGVGRDGGSPPFTRRLRIHVAVTSNLCRRRYGSIERSTREILFYWCGCKSNTCDSVRN